MGRLGLLLWSHGTEAQRTQRQIVSEPEWVLPTQIIQAIQETLPSDLHPLRSLRGRQSLGLYDDLESSYEY